MSDTPSAVPPVQTETPQDPFVANLVKSLSNIVTPEPVVDPESSKRIAAPMSLGDAVVRDAAIEKARTSDPNAALTTDDPAKPVLETPPAKPVLKVIKVQPVVAAPVAPAPAPVAPVVPVADPKAKEVEDLKAWESALDEDDKDHLAIARYADAHGKPGTFDAMVNYLKKVNAYLAEHPDADEQGEDFTRLLNENRPQISDRERRQFERQMLKEEAVAEAEQRAAAKMEPTIRELREMKLKPQIDQTVKAVGEMMAVAPTGENAPLAISPDVAKTINEKGYAEAQKQFPIEAPIFMGHVQAARSWMELNSGVRPMDEANPTDRWVVGFVEREGQNMMQMPESVRVRQGRSFLPMDQYGELQRRNPAEAAKHWTFDNSMILDMLAANAQIAYTAQHKSLEAAGYTRATPKKSSSSGENDVKPTPTSVNGQPTPSSGGPRAGARPTPGIDSGDKPVHEHAAFFEKLYKGSSKVLDL